MIETATYDAVLALARRLPLAERLRLVSALSSEAAREVTRSRPPFPVIRSGRWSDDVPLRREELYDDTGRA